VPLAADLAAGLQHLHSKGVVHRDLRPAHVLLDGEDVFFFQGLILGLIWEVKGDGPFCSIIWGRNRI
jgi:serine/threonine protein kinase